MVCNWNIAPMIIKILLSIANYGVFLPGMVMILLPVLKWSKIPVRRLWITYGTAGVLLCVAGGTAEAVAGISIPNALLLAMCFLPYIVSFNLPKKRLLYTFLSGTAFLSFGGLLNNVIAAESGLTKIKFSPGGLIFQYALSLVLLLMTIKIRSRITWFLEQDGNRTLWNTIWILPLIITALNIYIIPLDYTTVRVDRVFEGYIAIEAVILIMFVSTQILLYIYTYDIIKNVQLTYNLAILESQINSQNEQITRYNIDQELLRQQRHDLKHQYAVLSGYLKRNETDSMRAYLDELIDAIPQNTQPNFCRNASVNSLCSYYAARAEKAGIDISIIIEIPEQSSKVSDSHLCIIIGNLLDNAIRANESRKGGKFIKLRSSIDSGMLYITMDNSYVPGAKNHTPGPNESEHGIGLLSVSSVAGSHGGSAEFSAGQEVFQSSVWVEI